jgi:hypothetical protein
MSAAAPISFADPDAVAQLCLEHLDVEDAHWSSVVAVLRPLQQALTRGQWQALAESAPAQEEIAQQNERMRPLRQRLRERLAATMRVPADAVSLDQVVPKLLPSARQRVAEVRAHVRAQAAEAQSLSKACALLAHYHLEFLTRFFSELTGGIEVGRYGREGTLRPAACGSIIQARG